MKIIINNKTKDLTVATCFLKVYQFLSNAEMLEYLKIFTGFMPISFVDCVCICRRLKDGYGFTFKEKEQL